MFKLLSSAYSGQVAAFMERCQGLTSMSKRDFYPMFMAVWEASFKEETILKAFEATGLSPLQPEVILKKFNSQPIQGSSRDSDSSALSASNWRKIRQLVDHTVADRDQRKLSKLNQTIHQLSIRSVLAEHDNVRLKEALINERQEKLQQAQNTAQRVKRRCLKAPTKAGLKKKVATQHEGGGEALGASAGLPPSQSRRGRAIKLPAKYR
ncbi:hypothetical protein CC86DRAFT_428369 [Ophiobolus disseminans]|uniref:Uncharacterized protein n=1 Tax=Ophiobolus disseminans TaxID=1469910 RepID=A0A6A6ZI98_9PLEO|nr:hypothetical protein CC86DRAFT_428369 [Ophiobolus disseminans]